jgi:hypothetical protein
MLNLASGCTTRRRREFEETRGALMLDGLVPPGQGKLDDFKTGHRRAKAHEGTLADRQPSSRPREQAERQERAQVSAAEAQEQEEAAQQQMAMHATAARPSLGRWRLVRKLGR